MMVSLTSKVEPRVMVESGWGDRSAPRKKRSICRVAAATSLGASGPQLRAVQPGGCAPFLSHLPHCPEGGLLEPQFPHLQDGSEIRRAELF